jgi:beta-lactamase class A
MITFLKLSETDPDILTKKVTYEKEFVSAVEHHIISSNKTIELGKTYTILELIEYMVMYSDNLAAYLLIQNIDPVLVGIVFTDLGVTLDGTTVDKKKLTPKEYASFFRVLYNGSYLNRDSSEKALEILSRSTFAFGMRSGLEEGAKASLKYGVTTSPITRKEFHECGIIYSVPTQPYILCIMTNGNNYQYMASYIKDVTTIINEAVKNNI